MTRSTIRFHKMHGLGNDFIVIDAIHQTINLDTLPVQLMADRHLGIGCDQLLIIESGKNADFFCRIVNSDGSQAEQCGNGLRCVARFIHENGLYTRPEFKLETVAGIFPVHIQDYDHVRITMSSAAIDASNLEVHLPTRQISVSGSALSMGNPHFIIKVDDVENVNISDLGADISTHDIFPQGTNVGFMQVVNAEHIRLRTYERGAGNTLACGSNACAAVASGILEGHLNQRVAVEFEHGKVFIEWEGNDKPVHMTGPAAYVFSGEWPIN